MISFYDLYISSQLIHDPIFEPVYHFLHHLYYNMFHDPDYFFVINVKSNVI